MRTNPIQPISFGGVKINGIISAENVNRLSEFTKNAENSRFISDIEKELNTDIVLDSQIDTVNFSHKQYGNLSKYIKPSPVKALISRASELTMEITSAIRKAEKDYLNSKTLYETSRRGC